MADMTTLSMNISSFHGDYSVANVELGKPDQSFKLKSVFLGHKAQVLKSSLHLAPTKGFSIAQSHKIFCSIAEPRYLI